MFVPILPRPRVPIGSKPESFVFDFGEPSQAPGRAILLIFWIIHIQTEMMSFLKSILVVSFYLFQTYSTANSKIETKQFVIHFFLRQNLLEYIQSTYT